jgi:hypothetical protein
MRIHSANVDDQLKVVVGEWKPRVNTPAKKTQNQNNNLPTIDPSKITPGANQAYAILDLRANGGPSMTPKIIYWSNSPAVVPRYVPSEEENQKRELVIETIKRLKITRRDLAKRANVVDFRAMNYWLRGKDLSHYKVEEAGKRVYEWASQAGDELPEVSDDEESAEIPHVVHQPKQSKRMRMELKRSATQNTGSSYSPMSIGSNSHSNHASTSSGAYRSSSSSSAARGYHDDSNNNRSAQLFQLSPVKLLSTPIGDRRYMNGVTFQTPNPAFLSSPTRPTPGGMHTPFTPMPNSPLAAAFTPGQPLSPYHITPIPQEHQHPVIAPNNIGSNNNNAHHNRQLPSLSKRLETEQDDTFPMMFTPSGTPNVSPLRALGSALRGHELPTVTPACFRSQQSQLRLTSAVAASAAAGASEATSSSSAASSQRKTKRKLF